MFSLEQLSLLPTILMNFWVVLNYNGKSVFGIIFYQHFYLSVYPLKVEILDWVKFLIFLSFVYSRFKFKALITKNHKAIGFSSLSSFPYNWDNVIHVIKKIYSIIKFKDSKIDLYNMDYISQSPIHCTKENIECVLKCIKIPGEQAND